MSRVIYGANKPDPIKYCRLPDSNFADVWLRKNIQEVEHEDEMIDEETGEPVIVKTMVWEADEVYVSTNKSPSAVEADFDNLYYSAGKQPTIEERLDTVEELLNELMEE